MKLRTALRATLVVGFTCVACAPTIVRTGLPPGKTPEQYDDRWHHGLFFGLADASAAYDVDKICPMGWSEFRVETTTGFGILQVLTAGIYTPSRVTIVCAATPQDPPDPAGEEPLP
jgi:Bor protein